MSVEEHGFLRVATVAPSVVIANPKKNANRILQKYELLAAAGCSIVLTPELSLTGYSCEDLFLTGDLFDQTKQALLSLADAVTDSTLLVVGAPLRLDDGRQLNAAVVVANGQILGAVPKLANPNYGEFYEKRWFVSGLNTDATLTLGKHTFKVAANQLFRVGETLCGIEICEDLWLPQPPSAQHAANGATIILNPSASPEQVAKADYRRDLVRMQSGSCIAAYVYAGASPSESTKDVVHSGHMLIAENAVTLAESQRFDLDSMLMTDIDWKKLTHERTVNSTFHNISRDPSYHLVGDRDQKDLSYLLREFERHPFIPTNPNTLEERASEIFSIQTRGLEKRIRTARASRLVIGLSGGLDSTLALLVCNEALSHLAWNSCDILGVTMPGPATSAQTLATVKQLAKSLEISLKEISIVDSVSNQLKNVEHQGQHDVTYENTQARIRTQLLFNLANQHQGIVVGTGDLSELALGWCTFNADHMSNYNVNVGIPKTLVSHLVDWYAKHRASEPLASALQQVLETPISPELLPGDDDTISQKTEEIIGPYELHDFFLYHFIRTGAGEDKIQYLATQAFAGKYSQTEISEWLTLFLTRFHQQQFKRTTLPPGPKVGTVSLSPRGDWRMPDEVEWRTELKQSSE